MTPVSLLLLIPAIAVCALAALLLLECGCAWLPARQLREPGYRPAVDVLIPAHNEMNILGSTLVSLQAQIRAEDRVWVVADNCTDETSDVARRHGVGVIERNDLSDRGKGFGLQYAMDRLRHDHRAIIVFLDADCCFASDSLDLLVRAAEATGRPTQARYQMSASRDSTSGTLSRLAITLKNHIRPRGLTWLGLPSLLTGSGMAIPWSVLERVDLRTDNTADDMQLSCDLTLAGYPPVFCEAARVTAALPAETQDIDTQRKRWIHGHLLTATRYVPRLLLDGILRFRLSSLAMACEVAIPPLSLLIALVSLLLVLSVLAGLAGLSWLPASVSAATLVMIAASLLLAWVGFARACTPATSLSGLAGHAFRSLRSAGMLLVHRQHWTPTPRGATDGHSESGVR